MPTVEAFTFLRRLAGVGVGGSVPVVFSFLAEVMPKDARCAICVVCRACPLLLQLYVDMNNVRALIGRDMT